MRFIYAGYYTSLPVDRHVILFESFHGKEISDSPLAMARALFDMPQAGDYKVYFFNEILSETEDRRCSGAGHHTCAYPLR